jgi:hypothetical protein
MSDVQSLLHNALSEYDKADNEVERLLDIIDKATIALEKARQSKRNAKIQLDEAIASASRASSRSSSAVADSEYSSGEEESQSCSSSSGSEQDDEKEKNESEDDDDQFDNIADEALEQIMYRLQVARIDPSSVQGASLLDELLTRLKNTDDTISDELIDELMDDLLNNDEGSYDEEESNNEDRYDESCEEESHHDEYPNQKQSRIKISRGGKVFGWYEGGLDDRGYAREGEGTMYYNAGHICSGYWHDDEMVGRGVYKWKDGHTYDVSKRL